MQSYPYSDTYMHYSTPQTIVVYTNMMLVIWKWLKITESISMYTITMWIHMHPLTVLGSWSQHQRRLKLYKSTKLSLFTFPCISCQTPHAIKNKFEPKVVSRNFRSGSFLFTATIKILGDPCPTISNKPASSLLSNNLEPIYPLLSYYYIYYDSTQLIL